MAAGAHPVYRVGDLLITTSEARVTRGETDIPLPKLSFDLLVALIERAPRIVSLDELMEQVWPGLVVSPETVSQRVSLLRAALDDDPKEPRYIVAVRSRGYRLIAAVSVIAAQTGDGAPQPVTQPASPPAPLPEPGRRARWVVPGTAAGVAVALALVAAFAVRSTRAPAPPAAAPPERSIAVLPFESAATATGDTIALGVAEAVLHHLASLRELTVVARTSSFAYKGHNQDARDIGRRLGARYLLEGSVQSDADKLRVTAQLIDAASDRQVWSVRLDRPARDIFTVQDEIALEVARALKLSLDAATTDKLTGQGTTNFDAYLAYLQGRSRAATLRIPQMKEAIAEFTRATQIDPSFAAAYVELAETQLLVAEFDVGEDRQENFEAALDHGKELLEHALQIDPANGHAYAERAYFRAFSDLAGAEADYRRGIALSPNYAKAYAGLAAVLYENPAKGAEALEALDRARRLDPLEPQYDVTKAVFLFYRSADIKAANDLLLDVVRREPLYQPALMRLGELRWVAGSFAEGIKYGEQALSLDPYSELTRRFLALAYLDIEDQEAAARIIAAAPRAMPVHLIPLRMYRREWVPAAEAVQAADEDDTLSPIDELLAATALRMQARATGQYTRDIGLLERMAGVSWDAAGQPHLAKPLTMRISAIGLADMLMRNGEGSRARKLLEVVLSDIDTATKVFQRGDFWNHRERSLALALLGDGDGAVRSLQAASASGSANAQWWLTLEVEPAYEGLRDDPRFKGLLAQSRAHAHEERKMLERLRTEGLVPVQTAARTN